MQVFCTKCNPQEPEEHAVGVCVWGGAGQARQRRAVSMGTAVAEVSLCMVADGLLEPHKVVHLANQVLFELLRCPP